MTLIAPVATPQSFAQSAQRESATPLFRQSLPTVPGKELAVVLVRYPSGAKSVPHHHAPSAFIFAYVLSGKVRSQVEGEEEKVYRPGESWIEAPGAHHTVSENASENAEATLLAVFIVAQGEKLTIPDKH
jgi:quercetin dioxygenase-like cupin family protein